MDARCTAALLTHTWSWTRYGVAAAAAAAVAAATAVLVAINHGLPHCSPVNHRTLARARGERERASQREMKRIHLCQGPHYVSLAPSHPLASFRPLSLARLLFLSLARTSRYLVAFCPAASICSLSHSSRVFSILRTHRYARYKAYTFSLLSLSPCIISTFVHWIRGLADYIRACTTMRACLRGSILSLYLLVRNPARSPMYYTRAVLSLSISYTHATLVRACLCCPGFSSLSLGCFFFVLGSKL